MKTTLLAPPVSLDAEEVQDPYYPAAVERAKEAFRRLYEAGIVDAEGRRIRTDIPADMQEDANRDFGG